MPSAVNRSPFFLRTPQKRRTRRALLWSVLVLLLLVAQSLLMALTIHFEASRLQDEADATAVDVATDVRREMMLTMQVLQGLNVPDGAPPPRAISPPVAIPVPPSAPVPTSTAITAPWRERADQALRAHHTLLRLELRDDRLKLADAANTPRGPVPFASMSREELGVGPELVCAMARRASTPSFSRSYFVPAANAQGLEVVDLCVPLLQTGRSAGFVIGTLALNRLLETVHTARQLRKYELSFVEGDGTRLARAGVARGAGVYQAERVVDLNGTALQVRVNSTERRPSLIPNMATALVMGLSLALFAVVVLLVRDVRRRGQAEAALAQALAFRKAMEDSLITGLRARDLSGAITYVNPAFCAMVGFEMHELHAPVPPHLPHHWPPYWPPEHAAEYMRRQALRLDNIGTPLRDGEPREGFESIFMRRNGERFPVMVYEAPLVDGQGEQAGWMSAVVDLSAQRRIEDISRQQQDRLQATARLATVGEMASLLSHELNQPLAAIASYASGSLNLLRSEFAHPTDSASARAASTSQALPESAADTTQEMLLHALQRIEEQAERAGRVIKSVHDFVRRREQHRETIGADLLLQSVLPLVQLQARKSGARIVLDMPPHPPRVVCDRTMLEQVLLNLTRNGIQAMETDTPLAERVLTLRVCQTSERWVSVSVIDSGPGISDEVAARLFTPFFTTRVEGMGLGLSLCRTVIEQHGGQLVFESNTSSAMPGQTRGRGTEFRFTLAMPEPPVPGPATDHSNPNVST